MGMPISSQTFGAAGAVSPPPRIAALSMYDLPELQAANDALWSAIALRLEHFGVLGAPRGLSRDLALEDCWRHPGLLLAQTCGYPLVTSLAGKVRVVATPRYRAQGCEGPFRRSGIVIRKGAPARGLADLRGSRCVINDRRSDSGMNLLRAAIAPIAQAGRFFQDVRAAGSHLASAEAVAAGEADVTALDAVTFAHLRRLRPALTAQLRVLDWTERTPGLPLITARATDALTLDALVRALDEVAQDPALAEVRQSLLLDGFNVLPLSQYRVTLDLEERALQHGYAALQ